MERDSFVFYRSFYEAAKDLPKDIRLEVYTAIMEYALYGRQPEGLKPFARGMFMLVKPSIDANTARFENGCKGGRKKKNNSSAAPAKPTPKSTVNAGYLEQFFSTRRENSLNTLCKNFGFKQPDFARLRALAESVIAEWELSDVSHDGFTDWSRHLISTMRIKLKESDKPDKTPKDNKQDQDHDYTFNGGFGGMDT